MSPQKMAETRLAIFSSNFEAIGKFIKGFIVSSMGKKVGSQFSHTHGVKIWFHLN